MTRAPSQQRTLRTLRGPVGYTALHFACSGSTAGYHNGQIVEKLIEARANIDMVDYNGTTPLLLCAGQSTQGGR